MKSTYQATIATDGEYTYAIFNYYEMNFQTNQVILRIEFHCRCNYITYSCLNWFHVHVITYVLVLLRIYRHIKYLISINKYCTKYIWFHIFAISVNPLRRFPSSYYLNLNRIIFQAIMGFDSGDLENAYMHPDSQSLALNNLVTESNCNVPGRWIYRIDVINITERTFLSIVYIRFSYPFW